jgi:Cro/C1-type HTH DNA-binding domain
MMIVSDMPTKLKLKEFLDAHKITVYALAKKTEGKLSRNSLYSLTSQDNPPKGILFESLDVLIPTLREMIGKQVQIKDLIEFE